MKLRDLQKIFNRPLTEEQLDAEVVIPIVVIGTLGGTPACEVKSISWGFDWDTGKVFITPTKELREIDRDEIKAIYEKYDELGWKQYKISKLQKENKKLKEQLNGTGMGTL